MEILIAVYALWLFLGNFIYFYLVDDKDICALCYYGFVSKYLYEEAEMNMFGCVMIALLYYVFFPILFIPRSIGMVVFWIFHAGRKQ